MARELSVPIVALTQLNREIEKENRGPRLSDLRDSGAIEENADVVLFLHKEKTVDVNTEPLPLQLVIAKNRTGQLGKIDLRFDRITGTFEEETWSD